MTKVESDGKESSIPLYCAEEWLMVHCPSLSYAEAFDIVTATLDKAMANGYFWPSLLAEAAEDYQRQRGTR